MDERQPPTEETTPPAKARRMSILHVLLAWFWSG